MNASTSPAGTAPARKFTCCFCAAPLCTEGYIGAGLAPWLMTAGHEVCGLDTVLYRDGYLYIDTLGIPVAPKTAYEDLRQSRRPTSRASTR